VNFSIHGDSANFVARHAHRPPFVDLVVALYDFSSWLRKIGGKSEQEIPGHALLDRNPRRRILIISAEQRIDLQTRNARQLLRKRR
jgi:hypothetical protein